MKSKIVLTIIVVVLAIATMTFTHQRVAPNIGTDLALSAPDLVDPSTGVATAPVDTGTSRMFQRAENWVDPLVGVCTFFILIGIWNKELKKIAVTIKEEIE